MSIYNIALFLHVSGAIGYFVGMGTWLFGFAAMRRAQRVEQVRALTNLTGRLGPLFGISVLLILVTGLYMAITAWAFSTGWIPVALVSLILIAPLGTALMEPRRRAIARLAQEASDGPLPQELEQRIHDPILGTALQTVTILLLGIVFLMTNKPELTLSLIVMAVALVLGLASGLLFSRATRTRRLAATNMNREGEPVR
jgi:ABC-type bacteriocin/lantibiotic exporter with double-glycine peptidase domain